jgi:hypothetical protein
LLTFAEWHDIWQSSGMWAQRGLARDQYRMVRIDKSGAFEVGNVRIWKGGGPHQNGRDIVRRKYKQQESAAKARGIPFLLTFEEWRDIWMDSGMWEARGRLKGQCVMARLNDEGPYALGNVKICLTDENNREREPSRGAVHATGKGHNYFAALSPERQHAVRILMAASGRRNRGVKKAENMRKALSATATGRKSVIRNGKRTWAYLGDEDYPDAR